MPQPRVCDMEALIEIYPNAVIFLFRFLISLLKTQLPQLPAMGNRSLLVLATYLAGMVILQRKRTQTRIAEPFDHVSHDQLYRLAQRLLPIRRAMLNFSLELVALITGCPGWFVLDDVFIEKPYARWSIGVYDQYDHAKKRHARGLRLVMVLWTNGWVRVPIAFSLWHAKEFTARYRTKNQIARLLIFKINRLTPRLRESYLVCDNWYASKQNLRFCFGRGIEVTTRLRKNAWVVKDGEAIQLKSLARYEGIGSYHYYQGLGAYVKTYIVDYPKVGQIKVAVVKHDRHAEPGRTKFLIARQVELTNRQLVMRYRSRWVIEEFFRDGKQHFGIADCQARELDPIQFHFQMVFLALVLCDLIRNPITQHQTMESVLTQLRSIKRLRLPGVGGQLIAIGCDGRIGFLDWETFLNPVRTTLSVKIATGIPESIYDLT